MEETAVIKQRSPPFSIPITENPGGKEREMLERVFKRINLLFIIAIILTAGPLAFVWISHNTDTVVTVVSLLFGLASACLLFCMFYRSTYRIFPNIFLAVSFFVFFIIMLSVARQDQRLLGLKIMKDELATLFLGDSFTKWFGWSVFGTALATVVAKASEDLWHGLGQSTADDYVKLGYRFKRQRLKLLTYRGRHLTPLSWMLASYILAALVTPLFLFPSKEGMALQMLLSLYFVAVASALVGFVLHQFITDDHLLRSEKTYIENRKGQALKQFSAGKNGKCGWQWSTYCQVLANIYCSRSPILYENKRIHDDITAAMCLPAEGCCARFLAGLVAAFHEINSLYCSKLAESEELALELQFTKAVEAPMPSSNANLLRPGIIVVKRLYGAFEAFFLDADAAKPVEKRWFFVPSMGYRDIKHLLLLDCLKQLAAHQEMTDQCPLSWICKSETTGTTQTECRCLEQKVKNLPQKVLALLCFKLPYAIEKSLEDRWGDKILAQGHEQFSESMSSALIYFYKSKYMKNVVKSVPENDIDSLSKEFSDYLLSFDLKRNRIRLIVSDFGLLHSREVQELAQARTMGLGGNPASLSTSVGQQNGMSVMNDNRIREQLPEYVNRLIKSLRKEP